MIKRRLERSIINLAMLEQEKTLRIHVRNNMPRKNGNGEIVRTVDDRRMKSLIK